MAANGLDATTHRYDARAALAATQHNPEDEVSTSDAIAILMEDHARIVELFKAYPAESASRRQACARSICERLIVHMILDEKVLYPACRPHVSARCIAEALVAQDSAKALIADILDGSNSLPILDAKVAVLGAQVRQHFREEEKRATGLFAQVGGSGMDATTLVEKLRVARERLEGDQAATAATWLLWRDLTQFGELARRIGGEKAPATRLLDHAAVPELSPVPHGLDSVVETLQSAAANLRRAAEDNAHAFKGPISAIRQASEVLKHRLAPGDQRAERAMAAIDAALERLLGLVHSSRRVDEMNATLLDSRRKAIDLAALARTVVEAYRATSTDSEMRLEAVAPDPVRVKGSVELLETVIENLVENAISFSPARGEIKVAVGRERDQAVLCVDDQGPGIPASMIERVFERYVSTRPNADASGTGEHFGIGLWIVRRNVEALGGTVRLENRANGGLRARVVLPLDQARAG